MRKIYILLTLSGILISLLSFSQGNPRIDKKALFINPIGMESAKKDLKIAEKYYRKGRGTYDEALKHYLKVYKYNPESQVLNYKIGICYIWTSNKKASLKYFLESSPDVSSFYYLALGRAYQYNLKFDKAKEAYEEYLNSLKPWKQHDAKKLINQLKAECDVSEEILEDSLPVFIINLGPIVNSYYDDYSAVISNDDSTLYFTSKRPAKEPKKRVSRFKFKERIMEASNNGIDKPAEWAEGIPRLDWYVNTGVVDFDRNSKTIYFCKGLFRNGEIYTAEFTNGKWRKVRRLRGVDHIAYRETSISFDSAGTAYFITDRRGGFGGKDIWMATYKKNFSYNKPVNLGEVINTPFDEEGVYITPDGNTLYFSSKGRKGMGGFDVYKSTKNTDGTWNEPVNMGYPINTAADEIFYRPTNNSMVALLSTIRGDSYGGLDIYKVQKDPRIPFKLIGAVTDIETGKVLPASVNVYDSKTQQLIKSATVDTIAGIYLITFEDVGDYFIQVDYEGYKSVNEKVNCPDTRFATVVQDFSTEMLKHPFTLVGRITDIDKGTPIKAALTFKSAANTDSIIGRTVSADSTGKYVITFDDKYDMIIQVEAEDYFSIDEPLSTLNVDDNIISKDISLKRSKIDYTLSGRIIEEEENKPVYAAMSFYHPAETEPFKIIVSDSVTGKYTAVLSEQGPFMIEIEANDYFFYNEVYTFPEGQTFTAKNFALKKMQVGVSMVINNILFNTGKATLRPESFTELNKLADLLLKNSKIRIEISGHTDNVGSASVNKRLSKERALTVKNYLVSRGVEQDRIEYQGYGYERPIAPNDTPEGRAKNRRVEMKIVE